MLKEIEQGDDELKRWARSQRRKKIFIKPDKTQFKIMKDILSKYPLLAGSEKPGPNADPWLIALVMKKDKEPQKTLFRDRYIVVTEESKTRKDRIPMVCRNYDIECINLIELFKREEWRF